MPTPNRMESATHSKLKKLASRKLTLCRRRLKTPRSSAIDASTKRLNPIQSRGVPMLKSGVPVREPKVVSRCHSGWSAPRASSDPHGLLRAHPNQYGCRLHWHPNSAYLASILRVRDQKRMRDRPDPYLSWRQGISSARIPGRASAHGVCAPLGFATTVAAD